MSHKNQSKKKTAAAGNGVAKKATDPIEELLSRKDTIPNGVIKEALAEYQLKQNSEQKEMIIQNLKEIKANTQSGVEALRKIRQTERNMRNYLTALHNAEVKFLENADTKEYNNSVNTATVLFRIYSVKPKFLDISGTMKDKQ